MEEKQEDQRVWGRRRQLGDSRELVRDAVVCQIIQCLAGHLKEFSFYFR